MVRLTFDRTNTIKKIYSLLKQVNSNVYHERVPQGTQLPYVVFNVGSAFSGMDSEATFSLEINVWDNKGSDVAELEEITNNIAEFLYARTCNNGIINLWFNQPEIFPIPDPDENIRRRQINFNVEYSNV